MRTVIDFDRVVAEGLVKTYGTTRALSGVSLVAERGSLTVVLGPNGSGKSTLLALLAGLARPTRGTIRYGDHDAAHVRGRIGVVTHAPLLYPDLTGRENLELVAELYGEGPEQVDRAISELALGAFVARPVRTYSRGQLQRTSLARALLPRPRLLLLDEPSTGLDDESSALLLRTLHAERDAGSIVVVISHDGGLVSSLDARVLRLDRGRLAPEPA